MKSHTNQLQLDGTHPDPAGLARRLAASPMRAKKEQERCDFGLFGDDSAQTDLVDMARAKTGIIWKRHPKCYSQADYEMLDNGEPTGWWVRHCGHPTALRPYYVLSPAGEVSERKFSLLVDAKGAADNRYELRKIWTAKGVSAERQKEMIAEITAKAQPGAFVGPFQIPADGED
jgi:hypothetical protein